MDNGKPLWRWTMSTQVKGRQLRELMKMAGDAIATVKKVLTAQQAVNILYRQADFAKRVVELVLAMSREYYILLSDEEAVKWLVERAKKTEAEARQFVEGLRVEARQAGFVDEVKIHAERLLGATFKRDIPQMGPCMDDFRYLQGWNFLDPVTKFALVSWVPAPLAGSTSKSTNQQKEMVAAWKTAANLPEWFRVSFGAVVDAAGMALAHFRATGKDPFAGLVVRTDTCFAGGYRLYLRWHDGRLLCGVWRFDDGPDDDVAVFALGVVEAIER
ncbi:MAG: hypothetical protein Q7S66_00610 [bacterium]|nr:hypothetical protein [bacterium]